MGDDGGRKGTGSVAVSDEQIARINFLARKAKGEGLTLDERQEQIELRQAYIQAVKDSLTPLLESIRVVEVPNDVDVVSVDMDPQTGEIEAVYVEHVETDVILEADPTDAAEAIAETALPEAEADVLVADETAIADDAYAVESDDRAMAFHTAETSDLGAVEEMTETAVYSQAEPQGFAETEPYPQAEPQGIPEVEPYADAEPQGIPDIAPDVSGWGEPEATAMPEIESLADDGEASGDA